MAAREAIPTQPLSIQTLMREAATYALVQQPNDPLASLAMLMPKYHLWDPFQRLLVLELLPGAENLGAHARRTTPFLRRLRRCSDAHSRPTTAAPPAR